MSAAEVFGVILAGGHSSRMRRDKAGLEYGGRSQLRRAYELAVRHTARTFVSARLEQVEDATRSEYPVIVDSALGQGPLVGIRSALAAHPETAWLVLACDLPFLSDKTLEHLLQQRDDTQIATAYRSAHDGLPEPLCAVWEPAAAEALASYADSGGRCPRKFMMQQNVRLIDPIEARALDNINTPEEYSEAAAFLNTKR